MFLANHPIVPDRPLVTQERLTVSLLRADKFFEECAGTELEDSASALQAMAYRQWIVACPTTDDRDTYWTWAQRMSPYVIDGFTLGED